MKEAHFGEIELRVREYTAKKATQPANLASEPVPIQNQKASL